MVEQTADHVMITDKNGVIEYVNPAFEKLTGYAKEEVIGQTPRILKSGHHDQRFYETLWQTILAGQAFRGILLNRKKNGLLFYEEKTITPLRDDQGDIAHFVSTGKDITERKRLEQEREQLILELREALAQVKLLSGLLPICVSCKKIRDEQDHWIPVEVYIRTHSKAEFSHGFCPECARKLYPDFFEDE